MPLKLCFSHDEKQHKPAAGMTLFIDNKGMGRILHLALHFKLIADRHDTFLKERHFIGHSG